jgi:hypothetical protein
MTDRNRILFSTLFYLVGFAMTFFGSNSLLKMWRLERRGIRTIGRIIEVSGTDPELLTMTVIEYVTLAGEVVQKQSEFYDERVPLGQEIPLIYDPQHPHRMVRGNFREKYAVGLSLLIIGISCIVVLTMNESE